MKDDEKALLIVCSSICVIVSGIIFAGFQSGYLKAVSEPPRFSVVDTYKGCSVVKFIPPGDAKSHYFLDCSK